MPTFPTGSHLVVGRGIYTHHGIYIGSDQVIHYAGMVSGIDKGCVESTSLEVFSQGKSIRIKTHEKTAFSGPQICRRAKSRVGENSYNFLFNNCEHFATWCVTGDHSSEQVDAAIRRTSNAIVSHLIAQKLAEKAVVPVARSLITNGSAVTAGNLIASQATRSLVTGTAVQGVSGLAAAGGVGLGITGIAGGAAIVPAVGAIAVTAGAFYAVGKIWDFFTE